MRAILRFSEHHVTRFRPIACTHFEMRYNKCLYAECWLVCWCGSTLEHLSSCGILSLILRFLARSSICAECDICSRLSVCLSVTRVDSQKWLKLGSCNFHHKVAQSLYFLRYKFNPEILMGSLWAGASNKGGVEKTSYFLAFCIDISKMVQDTTKVTSND